MRQPDIQYFTSEAYQQKATKFCKEWLGDKTHFEVQTSGSTGIPKKILLSRQQMQASAKLTGKTFGLRERDTALVCLNIEYIAGMMMLVRGLELGLNLIVVEPSANPLAALATPIDDLPTFDFLAFVPLQLENILSQSTDYQTLLNKAKAIIVGGASVNDHLLAQIQSLTVPTYSTYGMTETVSHIAIRRLNGKEQSSQFLLLEGEIKTDERGCLAIQSAATDGQWIQTNDVVQLIDNQHFELIGRADNIINSGGIKIQLEEIEQTIEQAFAIKSIPIPRFFAYGLPDEQLGQKLVIVVEGNGKQHQLFKENLAQVVFKNKYHQPKSVYLVERFLETPTGKIDKKNVILSLI